MTAKWSDIQQSDSYKSLSPDEQVKLKQRYFDNVVLTSPSYTGLPDSEKKATHDLFYGQTTGALGGVSLNNLQDVPSTTPKPRPALSTWEAIKGGVKNMPNALKDFYNSAKYPFQHPEDAYHLMADGTSKAATSAGLAATKALLHAAGKDSPDQAAMDAAQSTGGAADNVWQSFKDYGHDRYVSRLGEPTGTALAYSFRDHPWQTLSDLSIPASLGATGAEALGADALRAAAKAAMVTRGVPAPIASGIVNSPGWAVKAMNPLNAAYPAAKVVSGATRKIVDTLTPQRIAMMNLANGKGPQIVSKMDEAIAHPIVDGSTPTAAEALGPNPLRDDATMGSQPVGHGDADAPLLSATSGAIQHFPDEPTGPILRTLDGRTVAPPPGYEQLPPGDAAPNTDSLLLDGHSQDQIGMTKAMMPVDESAGAAPTNAMVPVDEHPDAVYMPQYNALNPGSTVEPVAPQPEPVPPQPQAAPEPAQAAPQPQAAPEAPPQPQSKAEPDPEVAPEAPTLKDGTPFDFMGKIAEVEKTIKETETIAPGLEKAITRSEAKAVQAEADLRREAGPYANKLLEVIDHPSLKTQMETLDTYAGGEPNEAEIRKAFKTLKSNLDTVKSARNRLGALPDLRDTLAKLRDGEEGLATPSAALGVDALEALHAKIQAMRASRQAAAIAAGMPDPYPGVGPRGVARPGSPGVVADKFAAAGAQAQINNPDEFTGLYNENNAARMQLNNSIGKTGPAGNVDRPTAEAAHDALAKVEYGAAGRKISTGDATFYNITHRDLSSSVMDRARKLLGEGNQRLEIGSYVPAHIDAAGNKIAAVYPQYSGKALQAIKQAFDDLSFDENVFKNSSMSSEERAAIRATRSEFLRWVGLRSNNPELITAMKNYAVRSNQIDRMKLAEHLEKVMQNSATDEYTSRQRANAYAYAIHPSNQANTIIQATGRSAHPNFDSLATPKENVGIIANKDDLLREALNKERAHDGRDYGSSINTAASDGLKNRLMPDGVKKWVGSVAEPWDNIVKNNISKGMETPQGAKELMSNALAQQKLFDNTGKVIRNGAYYPTLPLIKVPTPYNALDNKRKKDNQK